MPVTRLHLRLRRPVMLIWSRGTTTASRRSSAMPGLSTLIMEWLNLGGPEGASRSNSSRQGGARSPVGQRQCARSAALSVRQQLRQRSQAVGRRGAAEMMASQRARTRFIDDLHRYVVAGSFHGAVLDLEQIPPTGQLISSRSFKSSPRDFVTAAPDFCSSSRGHDDYDYPSLAASADRLILMTYDEHFEAGVPGPIAGQGWFEAKLDARFADIDASKLIVSIGSYASNWAGSAKAGRSRSRKRGSCWPSPAPSCALIQPRSTRRSLTLTETEGIRASSLVSRWRDGLQPGRRGAGHAPGRPGAVAARHRGSGHLAGLRTWTHVRRRRVRRRSRFCSRATTCFTGGRARCWRSAALMSVALARCPLMPSTI